MFCRTEHWERCATLRATGWWLLMVAVLALAACRKEPEVIGGNQAPNYEGVPTVLVENYVNRLFIDLLGREPLDVEMSAEVGALEAAGLSMAARTALVQKVMTSTAFLADDSSYRNKFCTRLYELSKARFLEGVSDEVIDGFIGNAQQQALADSLGGNTAGLNAANTTLGRLRALKRSRTDLRDGLIGITEMMRRMVLNAVYDEIHMNSFNYVNATFDNLLLRYPTDAEFAIAYGMVEQNTAGVLFGQSGQNKGEYAALMSASAEAREGLVRWSYVTFMGRLPDTAETVAALDALGATTDIEDLLLRILTTDEYANIQ